MATEFLVLIAALLELKSRLMLPGRRGRARGAEPGGGGRGAAGADARVPPLPRRLGRRSPSASRRSAATSTARRRCRRELRRVAVDAAIAVYDPEQLGAALGDLLTEPPEVDISHIRPTVSLERRLRALRDALSPPHQLRLRRGVRRRGPADPGGDALRPARALPQGRGDLGAERAVRPDRGPQGGGGRGVSDLARTIEALLFLSPQPVSAADLAEATEATEGQVAEAIELLREDLAEGKRGVVLREVAGGFALASDPASEDAARRLLAKPRTPPLTQAQAETLAIVAYLQPVSRPEIARIRGVSSESAVQTLAERGLIEESGRSRFGAAIFKTTELFERLFGLSGLDQLPDPSRFDPTPEDERELRERLLKAGEQRAE